MTLTNSDTRKLGWITTAVDEEAFFERYPCCKECLVQAVCINIGQQATHEIAVIVNNPCPTIESIWKFRRGSL